MMIMMMMKMIDDDGDDDNKEDGDVDGVDSRRLTNGGEPAQNETTCYRFILW